MLYIESIHRYDPVFISLQSVTNSSLFIINPGLTKIRSLLLARRSGATSCLICLERVRATDPVWDCKAGCHVIFHLICIQSWARQALGAAAIRSLGQLSGQHFPAAQAEAEDKACWHCPKCRSALLALVMHHGCF